MYNYKGFEIIKTSRWGYTYWKVCGSKKLFSTLKAAKAAIDASEKSGERRTIVDKNGILREQIRFLPLGEWDIEDGSWITIKVQ